MTTYKIEIAEEVEGEPSIDGMVAVTVQGFRVRLPLGLLTEVKPPLPEEPPVGSLVYAGSLVLQRRDDHGIDWWEYQGKCWLTWVQVCELGTPVRLIPESVVAPVELPWHRQDHDGGLVKVEVSDQPEYPGCVFVYAHGSFVSTDRARDMAAALNAAADAVKASHVG